jgi:hypothetical protein
MVFAVQDLPVVLKVYLEQAPSRAIDLTTYRLKLSRSQGAPSSMALLYAMLTSLINRVRSIMKS